MNPLMLVTLQQSDGALVDLVPVVLRPIQSNP
jgi:hypothetical protein